MNKSIERQINNIYNSVFKKIFTEERSRALSNGNRSNIASALLKLDSSKAYNDFATKFSIELAKKGLNHQKGLWKKYYNAAKKLRYIVLPSSYSDFEKEMMSEAIKHNFSMIKSIPDKIMEILNHDYTNKLIEEVAEGKLPRGSFLKELKKHGVKQANLIARTETAKLQTAIMENRATSLGSVCYKWRSSKDKRTRPSHRAMNGVIVFWGNNIPKPELDGMVGNAGEFPNCRCDADPIFSERDLTQSNYKVYDYNKKIIINISKKELLEAIKRRSL